MLKKLLFAALLLLTCAAQAAVYSLPWGPKPQFMDANGAPMSSGTLLTFAAGSSTPQVTYTDSTGGVANPTTITLNTRGESPNEVWLTGGLTYKFVLKDSSGVTIWTVDNVQGVNDIAISNAPSEWIAGPAPTYVSATQFTLAGDQTLTFTAGRRVKTTNSGGTIYSTITSAVFGLVTTVTIANDSGSIDSGLSAVSYGMLASLNQSQPPATDVYPQFENNADKTKRMTVSLSALTTATNRTATAPDSNFTLGSPRGYIDGLTMSTVGSSSTMTIATGIGRDSTNAADIALASSLAKTTASWTVGAAAGCLDTGAIANSTWYHFYAIMRPDTGVTDVLCSVSASAPTMPSNYTYKRRIGAGFTDGSAKWTQFTQDGDYFRWNVAPTLNTNTTNPGTAAITPGISVPTGFNVIGFGHVECFVGAGGTVVLYLSDPDLSDDAPSFSAAPLGTLTCLASTASMGQWQMRTNTSAQIRYRVSFSDGNTIVRIQTMGWIDPRGKNQ